jgi:3-methyladenine DNA glycosylase/8-oxoguanine DNA glycosylase
MRSAPRSVGGTGPLIRRIDAPHPIDLGATLFPLRRGTLDPTTRIEGHEAIRAMRTDAGPATVHLRSHDRMTVEARAWGPGAEAALEAAPGLIGAHDDDTGFAPRDAIVAGIWRERRGIRLTRTGEVAQATIPAILEQKVTGREARRAYARLVHATADPAPGPFAGLRLPPDPQRVSALGYAAFHPFGVERRRADLVRRVCRDAARLDALAARAPEDARDALRTIPGIGPWTAAEVTRLALGDPDAVSVGDYHLPNLVAWALAGEARGDDERMLELLEPYRGHRGRVQVLLEAAGIGAPRFGPRMPVREIERI